MDSKKSKIGEILKELRGEKGLSQSQLAKLTGIPQSNIARYELGQSEPKASDITKLCEFFGVSADFLLNIEK